MKQKTKELIEKYERAFRQGKRVMWFGRPTGDLRYYAWLPVTDIKQIKKMVLKDIDIRIF